MGNHQFKVASHSMENILPNIIGIVIKNRRGVKRDPRAKTSVPMKMLSITMERRGIQCDDHTFKCHPPAPELS